MITKEDIDIFQEYYTPMWDNSKEKKEPVQLEFDFMEPKGKKQVLDPYDDAPVVGDAYKQDFSKRGVTYDK